MRALEGMVVVVVLLVRTHCEVRARDPGEEEEETGGGAGREAGEGARGWEQQKLQLDDLLDEPETTQPPGPESQSPPETLSLRTGNWCAFVLQRVVTSVVKCDTEKYTIRTPCPPETPDCRLVMVQAPSQPVYREQKRVFSALQWKCCPGHSGRHCQDSDERNETQSPDPQLPNGLRDPGNPLLPNGIRDPGNPQLHHGNRDPGNPQLHHGNRDPGSTQPHHGNHDPGNPQLHHGNRDPGNPQLHHGNHHQTHGAQSSDHREAEQLVPAVAAFVLAELNPVLEGFNRSLALLDQQVRELARDLAQWSPNAGQMARGHSESRLEELLKEAEERLQSKHKMLHHSLSSFRTEVDVKLKHSEKTMQTSIQSMNTTLRDLRTCQKEIAEDPNLLRNRSSTPLHPTPAWTIVKHLNSTTINNTVKLDALEEAQKKNSQLVGDLQRSLWDLEKQINETRRESEVHFSETGLNVEQAREVVLGQFRELEGNVSLVAQQMQARDNDVDFLFTLGYNCTALRDNLARLERDVTNLTELTDKKRPAPEEGGPGGSHGGWEPLVKELQMGLKKVEDFLATEHGVDMEEKMRRLSSSFKSLLQDASRHSDVLETLMGKDVLEFLHLTPLEQKAHSIPSLKEQIRSLQEELMQHNLSISMLQRDTPMLDQPLSTDVGVGRRSHVPRREQQILIATEPAAGGGATLQRVVEELEVRVQALEEHGGGGREEQLQQEMLWLRKAVEHHLRVFKNVFTQAETLEDSHRTLDLQELWTLTQDSRRERRRGERRRADKDGERRRGEKDGEKDSELRRGALRSRRDTTAPPAQPHSSPLLLATWGNGLHREGRFLVFRASLNVGGVYSETSGRFTAPRSGLYLLLLTLDLRPGHTHLLLRRRSEKVLCLLQEEVMEDTGALSFIRLLHLEDEEELSVELRAGALESSSNALAVMLLH